MVQLPDFLHGTYLYPIYRVRGGVHFEIHNGKTFIYGADEVLLDKLDRECRYPTQMAAAYAGGFVDPENQHGGGWDGWIRLLRRPKTKPPWIPTGLLGQCVSVSTKFGYVPQCHDKRVRPMEDIPDLFKPIDLRDYQRDAVAIAVKSGRGVFDMPPRSGKTRTMAEVIRQLALPTLWIAPTSRIVGQTVEVLKGFFGESYVTELVGTSTQQIDAKYKIVVCTYASAALLSPEFFQTRQVIVGDEFHHCGSDQGTSIFNKCEHIYFRYGMTGTFFRSGEDEMAMHALLSNTLYKITSTELVKRGYLTPTRVVFLPVIAPRLRTGDSMFQTGHGKRGIQEHELRNLLVANAAILLHRMGKRVLVLVGTKIQGDLLKSMIQPAVQPTPRNAEFDSVEFCSTNMTKPKIERAIKSFLESNEVKIIIGTSLLGEGVDLPSADALVYARGEQAEVTLVQNAYRVATAIPGKTHALVVEFADRHHKKLLEHSQERLRVYFDDPLFSVEILDDPNQLPAWMQWRGI